MSIQVLRAGLLTTVQDVGRYGFQKYGVIVSGAMDSFALRVANLLVGNDEAEAALEITLMGPRLLFEADTLIAICGGDLSPVINGRPISGWRPTLVKQGSVLEFGAAKSGCRAYLAVAGGFDLPLFLGSRSTYLRAEIGGYQGRSLKNEDVLTLREPAEAAMRKIQQLAAAIGSDAFCQTPWFVSSDLLPAYQTNPTVRVLRGAQFEYFTSASREQFFSGIFQVSTQSDRMGYRLTGPRLELSEPLELISEAVGAGSVQVPPEGNPIVLLADRQTVGGYPKIAQVATVDLPVLAQTKPGESIRFEEVNLEEAQTLLEMREYDMQILIKGISQMD